MSKKYYWLKLKEDFFRSKEIKKLRKIAGGDTYTIIYLKLQLLSIKTGGMIEFDGTEQNMVEQLALEIDEDSENIAMTITYLISNKLIESNDNQNILVSSVIPLIGKETDGAERVRKHRELQQKALQCNADVMDVKQPETKCNTEIEIEKREKRKEKRSENFDVTISQYTDDDTLRDAIHDFLDHRVSLKKPIKNIKTLQLVLKELDKHEDKVAVIEQSICNGWQGLFEVKNKNEKSNKNKNSSNVFDEIGKERGYWK